ncbi:espin-like [Oscarella lobularis]|uniref:espin-like n=1 Tax=Oscarella lobularis TaxID=121494 RepID=UPI003313B082
MSSRQTTSKKKKSKNVTSSSSVNSGSIGRGKAACRDCLSVVLSAHRAALHGHTACLKGLIAAEKRGKRRILPADRNGATPLHLAARENNVDAIRLLLKSSRFNVNSRGLHRETAVHVAAVRGSLESLELLVSFNPRDMTGIVGDVDGRGFTPLALACVKNRQRIVAWILESFGLVGFVMANENRTTAAHLAAAAGNIESLRVLGEFRRQAVWYRDQAGCSPLYFAAQEGHMRCVEYLVEEAKADPLAQAKDGMTSIHAAAQGGHTRVAEYLIEKVGVGEVLRQTVDGATPAHFAAAKGHGETLTWLLRIGGCVAANMKDQHGCTPSHDAADAGFSNCLKVLVDAGADIFLEDKDGMCPYTLAISHQKEHPDCALFVQHLWAQSWESGVNHKQLPFSDHRTGEFKDATFSKENEDSDTPSLEIDPYPYGINALPRKTSPVAAAAEAIPNLTSVITSGTLERQIRKLSSEIGMDMPVDVDDLYASVLPSSLRRSKPANPPNSPTSSLPSNKKENGEVVDSISLPPMEWDADINVTEDAARASQKKRKDSSHEGKVDTFYEDGDMMSELETVFEKRGLMWKAEVEIEETHM